MNSTSPANKNYMQPQPQPWLQLALKILDLRVFEESHRAAMKRSKDELGGPMFKFCEVSAVFLLLKVIPDTNSSSITQTVQDMCFAM